MTKESDQHAEQNCTEQFRLVSAHGMRQATASYLALNVRPQGGQACLVHAEVAQADPQDALRAKQVSWLECNTRACACALLLVTPASAPSRSAL